MIREIQETDREEYIKMAEDFYSSSPEGREAI